MRNADIGITSGRVKCVLINSAGVGKSPRETTRVVRRTKLRIGDAMRTTADAVAAVCPGPPHRVADRDVDSVRRKREPALSHCYIDDCAGSRWHAARSRPAVLIDNTQRRVLRVRNIAPLTIRTAFREPRPTKASFTRTRLPSLALMLTTASCTALLA